MEAEPPMPDLSVSSVEAERRRETRRVRDRERRQSMSTEQREIILQDDVNLIRCKEKDMQVLEHMKVKKYRIWSGHQVAAIIVDGDEVVDVTNKDIIVQTIGGQLMNIKEFSVYYDPLQYPLLLPYGTYGWDNDCRTSDGTRVTCCDYYAYMLQIRMHHPSILLYGGRLLQQHAVDNYVKIETQKLKFIRTHQQEIRAGLYQDENDKLNIPDDYDCIVRAEIPDKDDEPMLGPKSFDDLLIANNVHYPKFKQATEKCGLIEEDDSIRQCLIEARAIRMPSALRRLFATIMLYCQPTGVRRLWEENYPYMIEDYPSSSSTNNNFILNKLLHEINSIFLQHKRSLKEFDLPQIVEDYQDLSSMSGLIEDELTIPIPLDDLNAVSKVNPGQLHVFNIIKNVIMRKQSAAFFIDGPGGTGKTFLYRVLLASFRNVGFIMVVTATSGIAAIQLLSGRTAHSKLKIPIKLDSSSRYNFSKHSKVCQLLDRATTIIWDEAPMEDKKAIETVDRTLRELFRVDFLFGGKIMILGGDFRQVVPVVVGGTRSQAVKASIVESYLWTNIKVLHLTTTLEQITIRAFPNFC
ncbi:UNVERIFIED_CONTAM: hypothetical protein Sangu_1035500 [Sesamum angustifolium]|uniref:ATP-dependent DNA helicase n=1 Tax=Sesamum angustifolium TaxID=2727405 RepID=A0AAW2NVY8_9LAMI